MSQVLRFLYVDDEPDIRMIVEFALDEEEGLEVKICASGAEALAMVEAYQPNIVLLDVMMPGMDGPTTLKHMKTMPALANTIFAFMTAKVQPQEISQLTQLGAATVISKPFDPMTLADKIREIGALLHE
jgi:CheY-like chemotaxis protein